MAMCTLLLWQWILKMPGAQSDYALNKYKTVDDYAYGGGAGMVMMVEPVAKCIEELKAKRTYDEIIYMSPDGEMLNQKMSNHYSTCKNLIFLCGHYVF